jgi:alpha-beta hydrolase superfamily lysophospholipase
MVEKQKHPLPEHIQVPWPEIDGLKLRVEQDGEEITLMTYRYPVDPDVRKGVIFYVHGFGSYCERYAF